MIRINLTPDDELVNPYWFLPDVGVAVLFVAVGILVASYILGATEKKIADSSMEMDSVNAATTILKPDSDRYDEIIGKKKELESKVSGLSAVTNSKVKRFRPVILLEHLQTLRPDGLWFESIDMLRNDAKDSKPAQAPPPPSAAAIAANGGTNPAQNTANDIVRPEWQTGLEQDDVVLVGRAFDNLIIAEFMSALKATRSQDLDPQDLRTQVFFSEVLLDLTETVTQIANVESFNQSVDVAAAPQALTFVRFSMKLKFAEREVIKAPSKVSFKSRRSILSSKQL